jgi:myo-inositol catabolism protein IolS
MEQRKLGETGVEVSVLALGCWPFSGGATWGEQDDADSIATVHAALDLGINLFDTAEGYEHSEEVLGEALEGRRDGAVIATKVSGGHLSADALKASCEASLKKLRTDYIDLYQLHWPSRTVPLAETLEALEALRSEGKIRAVGVCNFATEDLSDFLAVGRCETNQLPYNLLWRVIEREIQPACAQHDIGILCYSPLAQGLLTGRYASADEVPDGLSRTRLFSCDRAMADHGEEGCEVEVFRALEEVKRVADGLGASMAAVSLAWVVARQSVTSLLVGARNPQELKACVESLETELPGKAVRELAEATLPVKEKLGTNADMWFSESRMR